VHDTCVRWRRSHPRRFDSRIFLLVEVSNGSNSEVQRCNREVCFARVSRHRQISRSGPVREESTLKPAFEEEPCFEMHQVNTLICDRVREAATWAASLHALMLSPPARLPPSWGLIPTCR
jgi:hypothetical protein